MVFTEKTVLEYKEHILPELSSNFCLSPKLNWEPSILAHEILLATVRRNTLHQQYRQAKIAEQYSSGQSSTNEAPQRTSRFKKLKRLFRSKYASNLNSSDNQPYYSRTQNLFDQTHQCEVEILKLLAVAYASGLPDQSSVKTINGIPAVVDNRSFKDLFFGFPNEPRNQISQHALVICRKMQELKIEP